MTNIDVLENKISSVKKYLKLLERYKAYSLEQIEGDIDIRGATERYLYLAIQAAIDLAEAFISSKKMRKPSTLSECFHILNENKIIPDDLNQKMIKMTGFRNIVAHDYEDINYEIVYDILQNRLKDIANFIEIISQEINKEQNK